MRRIATLAGLLTLAGCAGRSVPEPTPVPGADPIATIVDPEASVAERVAAVDAAWARVEAGTADRQRVRAELKEIAWGPRFPTDVRVAAIGALVTDNDPEGVADMKRFVHLRLPTEPSLRVVREVCQGVAGRGWVELTPALVRSYSRAVEGVEEGERPERVALDTLHPDEPIERVVFDVFMDPRVDDGSYGLDRRERTRADAWDLLGRLDPDGVERAALLAGGEAAGDPLVEAVNACLEELRTIPITGQELVWLARLAETRAEPGGWWEACREVVEGLPEGRLNGLRLRHLEALRWAAARRPELLEWSRDSLLDSLRSADAQRPHYRRANPDSPVGPTRDRLREWEDRLTWADLVTLHVVDEGVRDDGAIAMFFAQAAMDRRDDTTEYGGLLVAADDGGFTPRLYAPRPAQRRGDYQFVASSDMIEGGTFALAHYHFHAQEDRNGAYAGPSDGDLAYATSHGRTCVVLTSVGDGVMGVDAYQPGGIAIDLGVINE